MQDLRLAFRALCATPIVTVVAALSLTLGIGANTAIFSLVNSLLLRPLPVKEPERLVMLSTGHDRNDSQFSYALFEQVRHLEQFDGAVAWNAGGTLTLGGGADTVPVVDQFVSGEYFSTLGVRAVIGRTLTPADDVPGGGPDGLVAMISYRLWQTRFGGTANIVGARITLERTPVTVVGVIPPEFFGLIVGRTFDVALPIRQQPLLSRAAPLTDDLVWLRITLRMKPMQSLEEATAALRAVQPQIRAGAMPKDGQDARTFLKDPLVLVTAGSRTTPLRQRFERPLVTILVVVALVLVIACANIANLMLARCAARRHELSISVALGASRWRLARQFLVESLLLVSIGTATGVVLGAWASRAIVSQLSTPASPVVLYSSLDWRVLTFTAAAMVMTTVIAGATPALRAAGVPPIDALKEHGRSMIGESSGHASRGLIVAQVALSLVLVVAAGLFVRTFERLQGASLGFDRDRVLVVTVATPTVPATERRVVYQRLVRAAADVPGVAAAGGSFNPPIVGTLIGEFVVSEPGVPPPPEAEHISQVGETSPGWFSAYGTAVRVGRDFDDRDTLTSPPVMLVNESFVRRFLPNQDPVGKPMAVTFRMPPFGDVLLGTKTIVGVVGDSVYRAIRDPRRPTIYFAMAQRPGPLLFANFFIAVRASAGSPLLLTRSLTAALTAVNPDLTLTFRGLSDQVNDSLAQDRVVAMLSGFFGALALLLAALGLYGVTAYAVSRRRTEIGIRMALGAAPSAIARLVLVRVSWLVGFGILVGAGLSVWASTFVASLLYGLEPRDPTTLTVAIATLAAVAALAAWLPAWRASRLDPSEALREG
jgi:putative ABC transport system permease protein